MAVEPPQSDSDDDQNCLQFKLVILGDCAVGKTSLSMRFSEDKFARSYKATIGVDFFLKQLVFPGDRQVAVQLWDIGGQTITSKMVPSFIHGSHAIILAYDITSYQSFKDLEDWMALVQKVYAVEPMPYIALLANKADLTHVRTVLPAQHHDFSDQHHMHSFFVSAKTGDNVAPAFFKIVADLAGVTLTSPDIGNVAKVITAQVINHPADNFTRKDSTESKSIKVRTRCSVM